jgi:hypothetical protein
VNDQLEPGTPDRRLDTRKPSRGRVIAFVDQGTHIVQGELIDVGERGFRMRYQGSPLRSGTHGEISYTTGRVRARVIWSRKVGGSCEGGFLLMTDRQT